MNRKSDTLRAKKPSSLDSDAAFLATSRAISALTRFLKCQGISQKMIREATNAALQTPDRMLIKKGSASHLRAINVGEVLRIWHAHPKYTDKNGMPIALPKDGADLSLDTLVLSACRDRSGSKTIIDQMIRTKVIEGNSRNLFLPASRSAIVDSADALSISYAAAAVDHLLATIEYNTAGLVSPAERRFERMVDGLPIEKRDLPRFKSFVAEQGQYFIDAVDDWLAQHRPAKKHGTMVAVGAAAFLWASDMPAGKGTPKIAKNGAKKRALPR